MNDEEDSIVHQLYQEHFIRERLLSGTKGGVNSGRLHPGQSNIIITEYHIHALADTAGKGYRVNCSINRLAELNVQSCTDVVRTVANFFLKTDTFRKYCSSKGY